MNGEELRCVQAFLGMSLRGAQRRSNPYPWLSLWESWHGEAVTERASSATHFPSAGRGLPALRILSMVLRRAASGPGQPLLPSAIHLHSGRRAGSAVDEPSSMVCLLPQTGTSRQPRLASLALWAIHLHAVPYGRTTNVVIARRPQRADVAISGNRLSKPTGIVRIQLPRDCHGFFEASQ